MLGHKYTQILSTIAGGREKVWGSCQNRWGKVERNQHPVLPSEGTVRVEVWNRRE